MTRRPTKAEQKSKQRKIEAIVAELRTGWPPSNPKAATARFQLIRSLAQLRGERVQDIIKRLEAGGEP